MKILSNRRYDALLGEIECQQIAIADLEEVNKTARSQYFEQLSECSNKDKTIGRLTKDLEDAKSYNQWLQERLNASHKEVLELRQKIKGLEAEIEHS